MTEPIPLRIGETHRLIKLAQTQLVDALANALATAELTGCNLPEMLRDALEEVAVERHSVHALIAGNPSSSEAAHVHALAAGAHHRLEQQPRRVT
jgi:hypothetical protein